MFCNVIMCNCFGFNPLTPNSSAERDKRFFPKITARLVFKIKSSFFSPFLVSGYFKNTKNLFIHIAHYPVRRFLRDIPTFLKCPLHSLVGAGVGSDRYQGDSAHETQPTRHCFSSRYRVWMCCSIALASTSPFAYFTYIS